MPPLAPCSRSAPFTRAASRRSSGAERADDIVTSPGSRDGWRRRRRSNRERMGMEWSVQGKTVVKRMKMVVFFSKKKKKAEESTAERESAAKEREQQGRRKGKKRKQLRIASASHPNGA